MGLEDDLKKLPPRAIAAFAVRCAMRVRPLFRAPDKRHDDAADQVIKIACDYASGSEIFVSTANAYASSAAEAHAAGASYSAQASIIFATHAATASGTNASAIAAAHAAAASSAAIDAAFTSSSNIIIACTKDLATLQRLKPEKIDPSETGPLGPLWPDGEPEWFRNPPSQDSKPAPEPHLAIPSAATPDLLIVWDPAVLDAKQYAKLVALLGDMVRAEGGLGVERVRSLGLDIPCGVGVPR